MVGDSEAERQRLREEHKDLFNQAENDPAFLDAAAKLHTVIMGIIERVEPEIEEGRMVKKISYPSSPEDFFVTHKAVETTQDWFAFFGLPTSYTYYSGPDESGQHVEGFELRLILEPTNAEVANLKKPENK